MSVGFFEEAPGVFSMARLCAFVCIAAGALVVLALGFSMILFALRGMAVPDGMTEFGGMAVGALVATFGGAWASLSQRTKGPEEQPQTQVVMEAQQVVQQQQPANLGGNGT